MHKQLTSKSEDKSGRSPRMKIWSKWKLTLVNLYVDLRCLRWFAGIYADFLEIKKAATSDLFLEFSDLIVLML